MSVCVYVSMSVCDAVWYGAVVIVVAIAVAVAALCSGVRLLSLWLNDDLVGGLCLGLCRRLRLGLGDRLGNGCGLQQRLLLFLLQLQLFGWQGKDLEFRWNY